VPRLHQAASDVPPHTPEADYADLHVLTPFARLVLRGVFTCL
jgi:hypothetical protein